MSPDFSRDVHVIDHEEAVELLDHDEPRWLYGYDAGWRDPRVVICAGTMPYGQLVIYDEFYREESHVEDAIAWLNQTDKPLGTVFCEHVPSEIEKFRNLGWHAEKAYKDLDAGINEVRNRLAYDSEEEKLPGLLVSERCTNLIREFLGYKTDHVGTSAAEDHCLDGSRYLILGEATTNPPNVSVFFG